MITRCNMNRLCQFAAFLSIHLRNARSDPKLLSMLVALDEVLFAGMPLPTEDETFARANGINLVVRFFGIPIVLVFSLYSRTSSEVLSVVP
jgi:hypothetical protein